MVTFTVLLVFGLLSSVVTSIKLSNNGPVQSAVQQEVTQRTKTAAETASKAAIKTAEALFALPATKRYLALFDDGTGLQNMQPADLSSRFWNEIGAAELVHNFGSDGSSANCGFDVTISSGSESPELYNQWQLQALGTVPVDGVNNVFTEWSETTLFGFPPFKNVSNPDMKTSTDRPFYAAVNMFRGAGGNPQCGKVAAILSRSYLQNQILAAPVDTGFFQGSCSQGQQTGKLANTTVVRCFNWPVGQRTLGVPPFMHHLLQPYITYYNHTEPEADNDYPSYNLARLLTRLLSRRTYGEGSILSQPMRLNFLENALGYFELNPAASIVFPQGVKMMVGMFELLWGTSEGDQLRAWCTKHGWPLAWSYNPAMSYFRCGAAGATHGCGMPTNFSVGIDTTNQRLLDPLVLAGIKVGSNVTIPSEVRSQFVSLWRALNVSSTSRTKTAEAWSELYDTSVINSALAVEPLYYGSCESEACVGVNVKSRACVCPDNVN